MEAAHLLISTQYYTLNYFSGETHINSKYGTSCRWAWKWLIFYFHPVLHAE